MRFTGKAAIVTGAAQGIGLACVEKFVAEGMTVIGVDVSDKIESAMSRVGAHAIRADLADLDAVRSMVRESVRLAGKIDVLVNNAGVTKSADFLDYAIEDFERILRINLTAAFVAAQAVARHIVERGGEGAIVNISSVNAKLALPDQAAYVTSKGGMSQLTTVMAIALADRGIRVNAVGPGTIATELTRKSGLATEESRRRILSRTPLGRPGEADEIASIVAFLASNESSYITGQTIYADGGRLGLNYTMKVS
jgi:NAD(P)-dependent dehydrogenase (short-subunit alcohol dehydrogenase family)